MIQILLVHDLSTNKQMYYRGYATSLLTSSKGLAKRYIGKTHHEMNEIASRLARSGELRPMCVCYWRKYVLPVNRGAIGVRQRVKPHVIRVNLNTSKHYMYFIAYKQLLTANIHDASIFYPSLGNIKDVEAFLEERSDNINGYLYEMVVYKPLDKPLDISSLI